MNFFNEFTITVKFDDDLVSKVDTDVDSIGELEYKMEKQLREEFEKQLRVNKRRLLNEAQTVYFKK